MDVIYPSILDTKFSAYANTRLRCDAILCLGFTIASTTLSRAILKEIQCDTLFCERDAWEKDVALNEMRRIASTLAGFAR